MLLASFLPVGVCLADSASPSLGATQTFHLATGEHSSGRVEPDEGVAQLILRFPLPESNGGISLAVRVACVQTGCR